MAEMGVGDHRVVNEDDNGEERPRPVYRKIAHYRLWRCMNLGGRPVCEIVVMARPG
jgi:hypothetical protein